jgi:hypothetical protein
VSSNAFWNWWGGATRSIEWDNTKDSAGDTNSGALRINVEFSGTGDNQFSQGMSLSGAGNYNSAVTIHTADYASLEYDVLWDTFSTLPVDTLNTTGDPQGIGIGLAKPDWGQTWPPAASQPKAVADGAWHHVTLLPAR